MPSALDRGADMGSASSSAGEKNSSVGELFPASHACHFNLVPGHSNTTTKDPLTRPPDMRLLTVMASKGKTLEEGLERMNGHPSRMDREPRVLQCLTTRDVVMIPDLFEESSGFVWPADPFADRSEKKSKDKTIYDRLVEEIYYAGQREQRSNKGGGKFADQDRNFSLSDNNGVFQQDQQGLFKAWHKTNKSAAGDGLQDATGRDGNGHLIVNDKDGRWQEAQQRGE